MEGILLGFSVIFILTLIGVVTAIRGKEKTPIIQRGLTPVVYYITNPALMMVLVSDADVKLVAGLYTPLALGVALLTATIFLGYGLLVKRSVADIAVGAMSASYVSAGNIGVPIALYMVGSTAPVVAVLLAQLLVLTPLYLTIFGLSFSRVEKPAGTARFRTIVGSVFNPVTLGVIAGASLSLLQLDVPRFLWEPLQMIGEASIPLALMIFGMSLWQQLPFTEVEYVRDSVVAVACKSIVMPIIAWGLGGPLLGLEGKDLLGVVAMAALPTGQIVLLFGMHYRMPVTVVKDTVFTSAIASLPLVLLAAWFLGS